MSRKYLFILTVFYAFLVLAFTRAYAQEVTIEEFCSQLSEHVPSADVAYKAGVDVRGKAVVPADLNNASRLNVPTAFEIPVTVQLAESLGLSAGEFDLEPSFGYLTLTPENRVLYNGQDITARAQNSCDVPELTKSRIIMNGKNPSRQEPVPAVMSEDNGIGGAELPPLDGVKLAPAPEGEKPKQATKPQPATFPLTGGKGETTLNPYND
ncbi:MAG: hypothetical protein AB7E85_05300 [Pseudobdellovibrionaceae bacterium]